MPIFSIGERRVELRGAHHYIAHDATLVGSVTLEADVSVWFKVVIRADNDRISIGDGSLIGINSIVMNGARIGKGSLIGANTLITEGKEIPDGVLVLGSPGKIVRSLTQEDKDYLLGVARGYVERAKMYRASLREI